jgi:plasmid replication initiation protein
VRNNDPSAIDPEDRGFDMKRREPDQPSLFPTEDLIIPDTIRNIRKAVSAIHATPMKPEHSQSLNSRRLFDACILVAQIDFRKRDKQMLERVRTERLSPMFETRITDLARLAGIPGKNYERIYEELDQLFEMSLRWNIVGEDSEVEWEMKSHFLSTLGYGRGHKRGLIRFSIDPSILEIVLEPSNWATLSLQAMEGLGTAASYALYQNCWRYINTQAKVTAILPTSTWVELLMGQSRYVVDAPEMGKRVVNYGDFKRRVLMDAIRRVNDIQALSYTLELKEFRSGTRVSKLQFKFVQKKQPSLGLPLTWPDDVLRVLSSLGFTQAEIEDLSQAHSYEEVADSILRLKAAEGRLRAAGRPITSKKAKAQEAQRAAEARHQRRKEEFSKHQADVFVAKLYEMDGPEREAIFKAFESSSAAAKARLLIEKGWSQKNVGALTILRGWLVAENPDVMGQFFVNPEDKDFDAWMAWRLDSLDEAR